MATGLHFLPAPGTANRPSSSSFRVSQGTAPPKFHPVPCRRWPQPESNLRPESAGTFFFAGVFLGASGIPVNFRSFPPAFFSLSVLAASRRLTRLTLLINQKDGTRGHPRLSLFLTASNNCLALLQPFLCFVLFCSVQCF